MSGSGTETLTAALRRLADEHASGLLSVATPGRDVVMELADGVPVGIGPTHDVSERIGRDASPALLAAAVVDQLVDRTVAAIVGGGGQWTWDTASDADMMPVPQGLAAELSRRAVDAAQALATLDPDRVLLPGRELETTGEVEVVRAMFDGERSIAQVAEEAGLTLAACTTFAAAMVRAGVLSTGMEDPTPTSWTDTVAGSTDAEDDEPELWVMDEPDDLEEFDEEPAEDDEEVAALPAVATTEEATEATTEEIPEAMEWVAGDEATSPTPAAPAASGQSGHDIDDGADDGWDDTTWMDDLGATSGAGDASPVVEARPSDEPGADQPGDARTALSSMLSDLQGGDEVEPRHRAPVARTVEQDAQGESAEQDDNGTGTRTSAAARKEPKAQPGEVAEFLRELSRLALDDE